MRRMVFLNIVRDDLTSGGEVQVVCGMPRTCQVPSVTTGGPPALCYISHYWDYLAVGIQLER